MQREGVFREMRQRKAYEKPSERKVREKADAIRRARKQARKTAIREGLIAAPKPKPRFGSERSSSSNSSLQKGCAPSSLLSLVRSLQKMRCKQARYHNHGSLERERPGRTAHLQLRPEENGPQGLTEEEEERVQ